MLRACILTGAISDKGVSSSTFSMGDFEASSGGGLTRVCRVDMIGIE